jgi:hypothetical protein
MKLRYAVLAFIGFFMAGTVPVYPATSVTQWGITWHFNHDYTVGHYANGDFWVLGPVTIDSITPHFTGKYNG